MKRFFIRFFGCVISAIGLGVSYDTIVPVVMGDNSAVGCAWGAADSGSGSGSGTGSCVYADGCYPGVSNYVIDSGMSSGVCRTIGDDVVGYNVILQSWYVGWPNFMAGRTASELYSIWPSPMAGVFDSRYVVYSGMSVNVNMNFSADTVYNTEEGNTSELCSGSFKCALGGSDCLVGGSYAGMYSPCVFDSNTAYAGDNFADGTQYDLVAIYMRTASAFSSFGCGLVDSSGSCSSAYKCCYGPANRSYDIKTYHYNTRSSINTYQNISTSPLYEPIVVYWFSGCDDGYYKTLNLTGEATNYALSAFSPVSDIFSENNPSACPSSIGSYVSAEDENGDAYTYQWNVCKVCPSMTAISNYTDITSFTATDKASASGVGNTTCRKSVTNAKDASGTFNFTQNCSYSGD